MMRSEFENHYLSLDFYTKGSAQICLDACTFDEKQDAYLPNMDWILENDEDECVTYCCMLNTAYLSFKHRQTEVDELTQLYAKELFNKKVVAKKASEKLAELQLQNDDLQKRVDATQDSLTELKEKSEALHHRWNILSDSVALAEAEMIDMCVKEIEQALKGSDSQ